LYAVTFLFWLLSLTKKICDPEKKGTEEKKKKEEEE